MVNRMQQPHLHFPPVGIDIGKTDIVLARADDGDPRHFPVQIISLKDPDWHQRLIEAVPGGVAAAEPTGYHYMAPIAAVLHQHTTAQLYLVNHETTGHVRQT
ncbi:MAG: hypothetical protein AAF787_23725, partial [Chloroflexota bacterium]